MTNPQQPVSWSRSLEQGIGSSITAGSGSFPLPGPPHSKACPSFALFGLPSCPLPHLTSCYLHQPSTTCAGANMPYSTFTTALGRHSRHASVQRALLFPLIDLIFNNWGVKKFVSCFVTSLPLMTSLPS